MRDRRPRSAAERKRRLTRRAFPGGAGGAISNVARTPVPPRSRVIELAVTAPMVPVPPYAPPPTPDDAYRIEGNKARTYLGGQTHIDLGYAVTEVEVEVTGNVYDVGFGFWWATQHFLVAQNYYGGSQLLYFNALSDQTMLPVSTSRTPPYTVRMVADWSAHSVEVFYDGVSVGTQPSVPSVGNPVGVKFRAYPQNTSLPATFDNLKVNGALVDAFTRPDQSGLGAGPGGTWLEP